MILKNKIENKLHVKVHSYQVLQFKTDIKYSKKHNIFH